MPKKILLAALMCCSVLCYSQARLTIFGGPQITSAHYEINGKEQPMGDYKKSFMAGLALRVPWEGHLFFYPEIFYSQKGYNVRFLSPSDPPDSSAINNSTTIHTIEVAPLLLFTFSKNPSHFFLRIGPSIDYNVMGTEKFDTKSGGTVQRSMEFSWERYGYVTASASAHLGFELKNGFQMYGFGEYGIGTFNNNDGGPNITHLVAGIGIGWIFGGTQSRDERFLSKMPPKNKVL